MIKAADVDESLLTDEEPGTYVLRLAESKARACSAWAHPGQTILAADTTVVNGGSILGKPKDRAQAVEMLTALRGHTHQVLTGVAALRVSDGTLVTDLCITDVPMRIYSDEEIEAYVASGDPLDKAGAYGIQNMQFHPVEGMRGCYASVMGLPLCHVTRSLRKLGMAPMRDIAAECQSGLDYDCPISTAVLGGEMIG
jgi:MAF protein